MTNPDGSQPAVLPERIGGLIPLSQNLWWSWQPQAEDLYRDLNPLLFESIEENPVLLLRAVARERLDEAAADPAYLARYDKIMARFNDPGYHRPRNYLAGRASP
jgi:starch phosphorylase